MINNFFKFIIGLAILFGFYGISLFITKYTHIILPPAILGLVLFAISLKLGFIKEDWIKITTDFMLKNMAILFVPFLVGLIVYKNVIINNLITIMLIVTITTTATIVITGVFIEYGIKYLRYHKMNKKRANND